MKHYKYRLIFKSTLCARIIKHAAEIFDLIGYIDHNENFNQIKSKIIRSIKILNYIIIDAETLLYKNTISIEKAKKKIEKVNSEELLDHVKKLELNSIDIIKKIAKAIEAVRTDKLSDQTIKEFSLKSDKRLIRLIKRIGIQLGNKINSKNIKEEMNHVEHLLHFATILIHRFKTKIQKLDADKDEKERLLEFLNDQLKKISKSTRYQYHETEKLVA